METPVMHSIWAVATNTIKQALRMKIAAVFIILLIVLLVILLGITVLLQMPFWERKK